MTTSRSPRNWIPQTYGYPARRLLGQVLVEGGFITPGELEEALKRQWSTNELLGEVLVGMGALDPVDLTAALSVQEGLSTTRSALLSAAGTRQLLGTMLLTAKRITPEQLEQALEEQKRTGERIGGIFVRQGAITREELDAVLAFQEQQGEGARTPSPLRLGEILVTIGQITRRQLDQALSRQGSDGRKLGEVLIDSGYIDPDQIPIGLAIQKKLVTAALVATLSMAASMEATAQEAGGIGASVGRSAAKVEVSATLLPRTTLTVRSQPRMLVVTSEDVRRGYVEVTAASRIEVVSNDPRGYLLVFESQAGTGAPFREAFVDGLGQQVQLGPGGGWIPRTEVRGPMATELSYRFSLTEDAKPGTYPWPFSLSAQSL